MRVLPFSNINITIKTLHDIGKFADNESPVITSTNSNQNVYTDTGSSMAVVSWPLPTASDNSGEGVTLTSDYSPGDSFPIGNTTVTYTARDAYGNVATSSFEVEVSGSIKY